MNKPMKEEMIRVLNEAEGIFRMKDMFEKEIKMQGYWKDCISILQGIRCLIESQITKEELFEIRAQEYERGLKDSKPKVTKQELYDLGLHETRNAVNDLIELLKSRGVEVSE